MRGRLVINCTPVKGFLYHTSIFCDKILALFQIVCRVHSEGTVEEHRQFWVLVAGDELSWQKMLTQVPNEKRVIIEKEATR